MKFLKITMILTWIFLIASQFIPVLSSIADKTLIALMIIPATHFVEFFIYLPLLRKAPGSMFNHFIQVMLHGAIYYMEIKKYGKSA